MTEKSCSRCGACCSVLPLFTQHMHPKYREYLLTRGLKEDKERGCILIPNVCQHLVRTTVFKSDPCEHCGRDDLPDHVYLMKESSCDIHDSPDRPHVCRAFHGQKIIKGSRIYVPPGCAYRED